MDKMRFKNFEIKPVSNYLKIRPEYTITHIIPKHYCVVKWCKRDKPVEAMDLITGRKEILDEFCCPIADVYWDEKELCWKFESVGTKFLEYYEDGLCEYILNWLESCDEIAPLGYKSTLLISNPPL